MIVLNPSNIRIKESRKVIDFADPELISLEEILNTELSHVAGLDYYVDKLAYVFNHWARIDQIVDENYGGYWDDYTLMLNKAKGRWFLFYDHDSGSNIYIDVDNQKLYVHHEYFHTTPPLAFTLSEFKELLEQWREIQAKKITLKDRIFGMLRLT